MEQTNSICAKRDDFPETHMLIPASHAQPRVIDEAPAPTRLKVQVFQIELWPCTARATIAKQPWHTCSLRFGALRGSPMLLSMQVTIIGCTVDAL
jgi:hypothetical protein